MKQTTKFISLILALFLILGVAMAISFTASAEGAKTPEYLESYQHIVGNGTPLYIVSGTGGGTAVYYMNGSTKVYVNPNGATGDDLSQFAIFAGPNGYILDGDTHVTMTGGSVKWIFGAGRLTSSTELDLGGIKGSAYISISGGTVGTVGAAQQSAVEGNFVVEVTGGSIDLVYGAVWRSNYGAEWRRVHGDSTIILTGGTVNKVFGGDGSNPVSGVTTLVATIPVTLDDTYPGLPEGYYEKLLYQNGDTWKVKGEVTIPSGATLTIDANERLSGSSSAVINNEGTIVNNGTNHEYKGTINNNGTINCNSHYYTYECDQTCNICDWIRYDATHQPGDPFLHTDNYLAVNCTYCNQEIGKVNIYISDVAYDGVKKEALWERSGEYTIPTDEGPTYFYSDGTPVNGSPIEVGSYYAAVTAGNVTYKVDFDILKSNLTVKVAPSVSYYYGEDRDTKDIIGAVVFEYTDKPVAGTWTRESVSPTTFEARFVPAPEHAANVNALALQPITYNMAPATPILTATSPSPSIMPGMTIRMNVTSANPYTENAVSPSSFTVTYRVGENGTPTTVNGLEFTLPTTGVALGDTVYVTVNSLPYLSYYTASSSNTVELFVGQVDYSQVIEELEKDLAELETKYGVDVSDLKTEVDALKSTDQTTLDKINELTQKISDLTAAAATKAELEAAKTALQDQIDALDGTYATDADVKSKVDAIQAQIDALDSTYATDADITNVQNQIDDLKATLATKVELEAAKNGLQSQIDALDDTYATDADVKSKVDAIQAQIDALDDTYATDTDVATKIGAIQTQIDDLKTDLENTKTDLGNTKTDLENTKTNLNNAITDLNAAIEAGDKALEDKISTLWGALSGATMALRNADAENKAELEKKIAEGNAALEAAIGQVQTNLDSAKTDLEKAIANGDKSLDGKIAALNEALNTAKTALEAADTANKTELEKKIAEGDRALLETLEALDTAVATLQKELDDTAAALEAKDGQLNTMFTVAIVIAIVGVCGNAALLAWLLISKRKGL